MTVLRTLPDPPSRDAVGAMPSVRLRETFLLDDLFSPGRIQLAYTGLDRLIAGGIVPTQTLELGNPPDLRADFFHERRESGLINIGATGVIAVDGVPHTLDSLDAIYIGRGARSIVFEASPHAAYYLLSAPAHAAHPTRAVRHVPSEGEALGDPRHASQRRLYRYIHPGGVWSCQLTMGLTKLEEGSVWNTMPAHVHPLRSEIYCYFALNGGRVFHILGTPSESRHLIVSEREAVLSPPWSVHCGVGTGSYAFIWGMAGENQEFSDMDPVDWSAIR
jgi:4-deoxy-L-threo-5-hexosulose-uronate ketol-isomerase